MVSERPILLLNSEVVVKCDEVGGEGGGEYRGAVCAVTLTSTSAMDLISSLQFIRVSLLLCN